MSLLRAMLLGLWASSCAATPKAATSPAATAPAAPSPATWSTVETPTFTLEVPPRWTLLQGEGDEYWVRSPNRVEDFDVGVVISQLTGAAAPSSLDELVTRAVKEYGESPELRERIVSNTRILAGGRAGARLVSIDQNGLKYLTTFFVDGGRAISAAGVAPERAFSDFEQSFARIGDSLRIVTAPRATRPIARRVLMLPAELSGTQDRRNIVWLYPRAAREKAAFDARIRELVEAGEQVSFAAVPEYEGESIVPVRLRVTAKRPNGETIDAVIENPPLP